MPMPIVITEKQKLQKEIQAILKEYEGLEGNIPHNHEYWKKINTFRSMK